MMKNLPQELLSEIFIACLPPPNEIDQHIRDPSSPPLLLCQVCSTWRTVAIKTHQLWTYLHIWVIHLIRDNSLTSLDTSYAAESQLVDLWGSRQGALPSSIFFQGVKADRRVEDENKHLTFFGDILSHLAVVSCQLFAALEVSFRDIELVVERMIEGEFPNLEFLAMSGPYLHLVEDSGAAPVYRKTVTSIKIAPNLKRIYLNMHPLYRIIGDADVMSKFHWERVTHLAFAFHSDLDINLWYFLLRECISLTHLTASLGLEVDETWLHSRHKQPVLHRNSLQEIILQLSFADTAIIFIGFVYHSVTKFRISFSDLDATEFTDLDSTHALLSSTPNVQELHTQYMFPLGEGDRLHKFLAGTQRSEINSSTNDYHQQETFYPPLSSIIPSLRTLVVDCVGESVNDAAIPGDFYVILRSRWLSYGWPSSAPDSGRSILFVVDSDFSKLDPNEPLFIKASQHNDVRFEHPFQPEARIAPGRQWDWKVMNANNLKYGWDRCSAWLDSERSL
ncbi:hypothetical protein CPB83DRAFT_857591 [Crepidotus variabilis]|uniref:F-box domain-containing protein n=1 Tax=Crepidotus variabilis TaxID=179855 RepID=A0A9P6ED17_9AGAR|nr:hypothetical protein CPB83DRAFT_857591 [Crepidotus variabilis]